jgi:hypothetical protein
MLQKKKNSLSKGNPGKLYDIKTSTIEPTS